MPEQLVGHPHAASATLSRPRRTMTPLHVFLHRHTAARTRVAALSVAQLPEPFHSVRARDLRDAQRQSTGLRAEDSDGCCTVFVDIEVLIDHDVHQAVRFADRYLSRLRPAAEPALRYVGTPRGLAGLIADLHLLGIADGVTLIPLRQTVGADRIISDVLPMLGLERELMVMAENYPGSG